MTTARVSDETFDDFLAGEGLLALCKGDAIKEILVDYSRAGGDSNILRKRLQSASGDLR